MTPVRGRAGSNSGRAGRTYGCHGSARFCSTRELYFSYAKRQGAHSGTAVAVGRLDPAGERIGGLRVIFEMTPGSSGDRHFGSRIVEAQDGTLFVTIGERGDRLRRKILVAITDQLFA